MQTVKKVIILIFQCSSPTINLAGMFKLRVIATIDNIKYVREFVYNSSTLPTSTAYDLSNKLLLVQMEILLILQI